MPAIEESSLRVAHLDADAFYVSIELNRHPELRGKVTVPTAFASFPAEMPMLNPPRAVLNETFNLVQYTKMPRGGHFAAIEEPALVAADVAAAFGEFAARRQG